MIQEPMPQQQAGNKDLEEQTRSDVKNSKKVKVTAYLPEEIEQALTELYISRYRKDRKVDRSIIISEAIQAMYTKENVIELQ